MVAVPKYSPTHPVRVVTAAALFDGHDAAINIMRRLLQSRGAEVIHLGHDRSVDEIVEAVVEVAHVDPVGEDALASDFDVEVAVHDVVRAEHGLVTDRQVAFVAADSAVVADPARPVANRPDRTGPSSRTRLRPTTAPRAPVAPKRSRGL